MTFRRRKKNNKSCKKVVKSGTSSPRKGWKSLSGICGIIWSTITLKNLLKEIVCVFRNFGMDFTAYYLCRQHNFKILQANYLCRSSRQLSDLKTSHLGSQKSRAGLTAECCRQSSIRSSGGSENKLPDNDINNVNIIM